jgi:hypothetical protein
LLYYDFLRRRSKNLFLHRGTRGDNYPICLATHPGTKVATVGPLPVLVVWGYRRALSRRTSDGRESTLPRMVSFGTKRVGELRMLLLVGVPPPVGPILPGSPPISQKRGFRVGVRNPPKQAIFGPFPKRLMDFMHLWYPCRPIIE